MVLTYDEYKKKKEIEERNKQEYEKNSVNVSTKKTSSSDIAPVKQTKTENRTWFNGGAFSDGYQFGDVTKTILGTTSDLTENLFTGALGIAEKTIDAGAYILGGGAKLFGNDNVADNTQKFIEKDLINEEKIAKGIVTTTTPGILNKLLNKGNTDEASVLGEKTDSLVQSGGQLAGTIGLQAVGVPWWLTTGVTSFGAETEQAFKQGATYGEAGFSGLVTAGAEILTEKISGGIKFGGRTLDDGLQRLISEKITNKVLQTATKIGVDMVGEGTEEVLSELISSVGKKLSYEDEKTWTEMLTSEEAMDSYLEAFIGGAVLGGVGSATQRAFQQAEQKLGRPLTADEKTEIKKSVENASNTEVEEEIAPVKEQDDLPNSKVRDKDGNLITVYHGTRADFDTYDTSKAGQNYEGNWSNNGKGIYFTDDKAEAMEYAKSSIDEGSPKVKEAQLDITNPFDSSKDYTNELSDMAKEYGIEPYYLERGDRLFNWFNSNNKDIVEALSKYGYDGIVDHGHYTVFDPKQIKNVEKAQPKEQKSTYFKYEAKETDSVYRKTVYESASKVMNDSKMSHKFADVVAKISEDKKTVYKFTNNQELKKQGLDFKGLTINGLVNENGEVLINVDSDKALNTILGHETTHLLEGTKEYDDLKKVAVEYAKSTGEYQARLEKIEKLYKGKKVDVEAELTSDIVGEYLFTDEKFVKELSVQKPTVFQKIKELIDDLVVRFKGTAEEKQLRKLQKTFEKAYQQDTSDTDIKFSLSKDSEGRTLTKEQQEFFKDSKVRDENGNLKVMYHGSPNGTRNVLKDGTYFTENKWYADGYQNPSASSITPASSKSVIEPKTYEVYLNITNPFDIKDSKSKDIYLNEYIKGGNSLYFDPYTDYTETIEAMDGFDWTEGEDLREWLIENHPEYDGLILDEGGNGGYGGVDYQWRGMSYVIFNSNQVKNVDNANPTSNPDIRYSLSEKTQRAIDTMGTTTNMKVAGYLTTDGQFIDFSGKHQGARGDQRQMDHREIADIYTDEEYDNAEKKYSNMGTATAIMQDFIDEGNIRTTGTGVDISAEPTKAQYDKLYDYLEFVQKDNGEVFVDLETETKNRENLEYNDKTSISKMINDIKNHYANTTDIRYSLDEDIAPVEDTKALTEDDLPALEQQYDENFKNIKDTDIAPDNGNSGSFIDESIINVKNKNDITSFIRNMFGIKINEARMLYDKIANLENPTVDDVYEVLEDYRKVEYQETLEDKNADEIKKRIRNTRIDVSNLKNQITDYNEYRKRNFGNLKLSNSGTPVDVLYQELVETGYFPEDVVNEADQLKEIENFMRGQGNTATEYYELSDSDLYTIAEELYTDIGNKERYTALNHMRGSLINYLKQRGDEIAPVEEVEAPVETVEETVENASETQQVEEIAPVVEQAPTLKEAIETEDPVMKYVEHKVNRELQKENKNQQNVNISDDQYANNNIVIKKKPTLKERATRTWDAFQSHFVNRNRQIDKLSKATGNNEIKFKGDRVNNISGEIGGDIFTAQTDNYGNVIGKSLDAPFESARKEGLDVYFDNYLKHKSNIERHAQGKGSAKVSAETSQEYVEAYESKYPQFIEWSKDVYTYNRNNLNNAVNNGLISNDLRNLFTQMYGNYVPFYATETQDLDPSVYMTPDEIKTSMPVKRAKGGSDTNLLSVEQAMIQQTYAYKNAIAKNDLYKEIGSVMGKKVELGADVRENPLALGDTLYADENGKYLTYYENGNRKTVQITDELYQELSRDLENQIRKLEEKYSLITTPLQKISQIRGQILTTYNVGFVITNPFKDIQDALLNTKHLGKYAKNVITQSTIRDSIRGKNVNQYATEFKKLTGKDITSVKDAKTLKGKARAIYKDWQAGTMWNRFITSYGTNSTSMEFSDGEVDVKAKNKGFLNAIERANNYMEVMFRYPEFKATLEKGGSFTEALYNAREVTTNFGRGGTISKAINRNGATFFNTSVQGMDKFFRNFSGENGARGFVGAVGKAVSIGMLPALLNHLLLDDDDEYEALPDYIKDNYYIFKTGYGEYIRIPKGRMISVLGSSARRTLELADGEKDAFEGYLKNASDQIGATNPLDENIFSPIVQAVNNEAWYGGDLVPTRLQNKPTAEQYDEGTDEFSKWLGKQLNISPYKINYVIDQYSGGFGDLILPMITEEAKSDGTLLAPLKDKFTVNSTDDNKYVGELYDLSEEFTIKSNGENASEEDILKNKYLNSIKSQMSELYKEKREIQSSDMSKEAKYEQVKVIQNMINALAKEGLDFHTEIETTDNYATVGYYGEYYKTTEGEWYSINDEELEEINAMGMTTEEKNIYFGAKNNIHTIKDEYEDLINEATEDEQENLYTDQKRAIIDEVRNTNLTDEEKAYLYDRYYGSTDKLNVITETNIPFDTYLELEYQDFKADKNYKGQTISGSKKKKVMNFIESSGLDYNQKTILHKIYYPADDKYNYDIVDYVFNNVETYETRINILEALGFTIDENGVVHWK
jgi:hypothetical protein